jgi:hypothetical protein
MKRRRVPKNEMHLSHPRGLVMTSVMMTNYLSRIFRNALFNYSIEQAEDRRELYKYVCRTYIEKENNIIVWLTVIFGLNFRLLGLDLGLNLSV